MMLNSAIDKYVEYRRSLGESFKTNANLLKQFCNYLGKDMNLLEIGATIDDKMAEYLRRLSEIYI